MLKNYLLVALRNIFRQKGYSLINISGLAIGLASAIFIILYISHELGYDRFHKRSEDIYRLYMDAAMAGSELKGAWNSPVYGPVFMMRSRKLKTIAAWILPGTA